jgi:hypothetical protein
VQFDDSGNTGHVRKDGARTPCPPLFRQGAPNAPNLGKSAVYGVGIIPLADIFSAPGEAWERRRG